MQSQDVTLSTVTLAEVAVKSHQFYSKGSLTGKTSVFLVVTHMDPLGSGGVRGQQLLLFLSLPSAWQGQQRFPIARLLKV